MKTIRCFLMLALVSFAMMSFATNDVDRTNPKTKISIEKAAHNPGLTRAIYQQVDISILDGNRTTLISAPVKYKNTIYIVFGTYTQWSDFFNAEGGHKPSPIVEF